MTFLSEPDTIAAAQYFATSGKNLGPEERLMLAVLEDAVVRFEKFAEARDGQTERLFLEAKDWILDEDTDWPFSFVNICEVLRLDSNYIRRGLLLLMEKQCPNKALKKTRRFVSKTTMKTFTNPRAA